MTFIEDIIRTPTSEELTNTRGEIDMELCMRKSIAVPEP